MTAKQVSELIEVKTSTVYHWVHSGLIPYVKLGKCIRFKKAELLRWIDKNYHKEKFSFKSVERMFGKKASFQKEFFSHLSDS